MGSDKDLQKILRALTEQGWAWKETKKGYLVYPPDRTQTMVAIRRQPTDKGLKESLADLRLRGFIWPWPTEEGQ